jgi:endo-1,4-beta-xylanase
VYLPENYNTSTNRYPVVYHLHGIGGSYAGDQINTVPASLEQAIASGFASPMIIIFPDGYNDSFWADSFDGTIMPETNIIKEIIPYVDNTYRTVNSREKRIISGFSMGGFGAAKFIAKFSDYFRAAVIYDGALLTWADIKNRHATPALKMFNNNEAYFNNYSPWYNLRKNAVELKSKIPVRQTVGSLISNNINYRDSLSKYNIVHEYVETTCAHNLPCLLQQGGQDNWKFITDCLSSSTDIEQNKEQELNLYPNPASDIIHVSGYYGKAKIHTIFGQTYWEGLIPENGKIDISLLASGLYFLQTNKKVGKFLVE